MADFEGGRKFHRHTRGPLYGACNGIARGLAVKVIVKPHAVGGNKDTIGRIIAGAEISERQPLYIAVGSYHRHLTDLIGMQSREIHVPEKVKQSQHVA